jgi:hypothetical protein
VYIVPYMFGAYQKIYVYIFRLRLYIIIYIGLFERQSNISVDFHAHIYPTCERDAPLPTYFIAYLSILIVAVREC